MDLNLAIVTLTNNIVFWSIAGIGLSTGFATILIMDSLKIIPFIRQFPKSALTLIALIINGLLAEGGVYLFTQQYLHHGYNGGWVLGFMVVVLYTIYINLDPEEKLLKALFRNLIKKIFKIADVPPADSVVQPDYTNK